MTSSYNDVYSRFLIKIRDYEFAGLPEPNATEQMLEWLRSALSQPYIIRIFESISADDEIAEINYTLTSSVNEYTDKNFVEELLGSAMVIAWVEPKVKTTTLLNQMVTNSKEQKFYAQQSHIAQLRELLADAENKVRSMLRDRGYIWNSYLGNV
jgi:arsenate reductase-like glutaredoxin family protein